MSDYLAVKKGALDLAHIVFHNLSYYATGKGQKEVVFCQLMRF